MKKLTLQQQLKIQLDLLPEEQTHQLKKTIEKSEDDSNIASMIGNTLSSKNIQTPFKKNDFEQMWQNMKSSHEETRILPFKKPYKPRLKYMSLTAAAVVFLGVFTLIFRIFHSPEQRQITFTLLKGEASIVSKTVSSHYQKTFVKNKPIMIHPGTILKAGKNSLITAELFKKEHLEFSGPGSLSIIENFETKGKLKQLWNLQRGRIDVSINKNQYSAFNIDTPHAHISVIGTLFTVTVINQKTTVRVRRGIVKVTLVKKRSESAVLNNYSSAYLYSDRIIINKQADDSSINKSSINKKIHPKFSDRIYLKSGMVVTGKIRSQSGGFLIVKTRSGILTISKSKVKKVLVIKR